VDVAMTDAPIRFDRYNRYVLPHPETGVEQGWTRITTVANTNADRFGLEQWAQRNTVLGIGLRPDLYALAVSSTAEDKGQLNGVVKQAQEAAKASSGANLGTALHRITERVDRGDDVDVPAEWEGDVYAYTETLADHFVKIHPEYIERIVLCLDLEVVGTLDRLVTLPNSDVLTVADLKTGKDAPKYPHEMAIQLSLYANATHIWTETDNGWEWIKMPKVDWHKALLIHLPVGKATCDLYLVDLAAGFDAARLALDVREWRKTKDLATPYSILDIAVPENLTDGDYEEPYMAGWKKKIETIKNAEQTDDW